MVVVYLWYLYFGIFIAGPCSLFDGGRGDIAPSWVASRAFGVKMTVGNENAKWKNIRCNLLCNLSILRRYTTDGQQNLKFQQSV